MISASPAFATANAILRKTPIFLIEIAGYSRAFTNQPTGVSGQYDWIVSIADHNITINDLDGGSDLGEFIFNVQDRNNAITGDFPGFIFEGKTITVKTGFPGMAQSGFALLFTGIVDKVASANNNREYQFTCVDNKDILAKVIYTVGDDGRPTDTDHRRTLNAHPFDIIIAILETEIGLAATAYNKQKLLTYRDGVYAGAQFFFSLDSPPAARDFIEQQLLKPLGGYLWVNNKGQYDFTFFRRDNRIPVTGGCMLGAFTDSAGQIVGSPFTVAIPPGYTLSVVAPAGATKLSLGVNDHFWTDNLGAWNITVNGSPVTVSSVNRPWNTAGVNANYQFTSTSSAAPSTVSVTPGTTYNIAYVGGTVSLGPGWPFTDTSGNLGVGTASDGPGVYAISWPLSITTPDLQLNNDNLEDIPEAGQADLINTLSFRFDKSADGKYEAESIREYTVSVSRYGQYGQQVIESDGMRSGFQGYFLAAFVSQTVFLRYGLKNLEFDAVTAHWTAALVEPGDLVALTSDKVPDRVAGVMGVTGKLFEVLDRSWNFEDCTVTVKLLDASYLSLLGQYRIAPDGTANYVPASAYQKANYMFLSDNTDKYSDGSAGHPLG